MTRSPRLWFATLGGVAAYAAHLVGNYWLAGAACRWGTRVPLHAYTLVLLVLAAAAVVTAVGLRRGDTARQPSHGMQERVRFMATLGGLLSAIAVLLIAFGGAANLFFDPCQGTL